MSALTSTDAGSPIAFDPFAEGYREWPYEQYARLRAADPVHRSDLMGGYVLTRYKDVDRVLKDPTMSSEIDRATPTPQTLMEMERRAEMVGGDANPLPLMDDPEHGRIRRVIAPSFRRGAVRDLNETITRHVDALLDDVVSRQGPTGTFDLIGELAYPMPVLVICELMGIPEEDGAAFRRWVQLVARGLDPIISPEERETCLEAGQELRAYLAEQVQEKVAEPGDDLTSALVGTADDRGGRLDEDELISQLQMIYVAGHEPVTAVLGNGFRGLFEQPDQLAQLRRSTTGLEHAVLELLRYDGPNQFVRRIATQDLHFEGGTIPAGSVVYPGIGAANHDPAEFGDDADRIAVDRPTATHHLQLGAGVHACLGTHLARLEIEIALRRLLERFDSLELAAEPTWVDRMVLRSVNELHVSYQLSA